MMNVPVILGSIREGRLTERVARYLVRRLVDASVQTELVDLGELDIPMLRATARSSEAPPPDVLKMRDVLRLADALVIVSPEYNGSYPGVLKNALDYFYPEYKRLPVGIATVSNGDFGGTNVLQLLRIMMTRVQAIPIAAPFTVPRAQDAFTEDGEPTDERIAGFADLFLDDLFWYTEAVMAQKAKG